MYVYLYKFRDIADPFSQHLINSSVLALLYFIFMNNMSCDMFTLCGAMPGSYSKATKPINLEKSEGRP